MAVNIEIKHTKDITIESIIKLSKLNYGVLDNNYSLIQNEIGKYTILYDNNCIGRGIELSKDNESIYLRLPLPTTTSEIELFYNLTETICKKLKIKEFYCDEEPTTLGFTYHFIEKYKELSINAIYDIENKIINREADQFIIFGALNPITLGNKEITEIDGSLENFEILLNRLQQLDVFYANPILYQRKDETLFGVYYVGEEIDTVVPTKPYVPFNIKEKITSWYVMIPDKTSIPYEDFINNINKTNYYDNNHIIVSLTENNIKDLAKYSVDMITNEKREVIYLGKTLDNGYNHSNKIKNLKLDLDDLAGYNHLAIYLRYFTEHNLLSKELLRTFPELPNIVKEGKQDLREIICNNKVFSGCLKANHFNDLAKKFSKQFYVFNTESQAFYPRCVDVYAEEYFGKEKYNSKEFYNEAYLFVPYNEDYYQGLSKYIDEAWHKFLEKQDN